MQQVLLRKKEMEHTHKIPINPEKVCKLTHTTFLETDSSTRLEYKCIVHKSQIQTREISWISQHQTKVPQNTQKSHILPVCALIQNIIKRIPPLSSFFLAANAMCQLETIAIQTRLLVNQQMRNHENCLNSNSRATSYQTFIEIKQSRRKWSRL